MYNKKDSSNLHTFKDSILYLIGNGFDLHHSINSKYQDFHKYVKENNPKLESFFDTYFQLSEDLDYLWSDFENDLRTFESDLFFHDISVMSEKEWFDQKEPKWSDWFGMYDEITGKIEYEHKEICDSFLEWLKTLSITKVLRKNLKFDNNAKFVSFNYTLTLEELYNIPSEKILHIHGDINSNSSDLIFGHGGSLKEIVEFDENGDSNRVPWSDAEKASLYLYDVLRKPVQSTIENNMIFFNSLSNVQHVIVLGHSLNEIDMPYFEKIKDLVSDGCKWIIVYYSGKDEKKKYSCGRTALHSDYRHNNPVSGRIQQHSERNGGT